MKKKKNMTPWVLLCLHLLLLVYSASGVFSKMASGCSVASIWFYIWYSGTLGILFVYAIGWQQIIKRIPLTLAFANQGRDCNLGHGMGSFYIRGVDQCWHDRWGAPRYCRYSPVFNGR